MKMVYVAYLRRKTNKGSCFLVAVCFPSFHPSLQSLLEHSVLSLHYMKSAHAIFHE